MVSKTSKKKRSAKHSSEQETNGREKSPEHDTNGGEKKIQADSGNGTIDITELSYISSYYNGPRLMCKPLALLLRSLSFDKSKPKWIRMWAIELFHWIDQFIVSDAPEERQIISKMTEVMDTLLNFKGMVFDVNTRNQVAQETMSIAMAIAKMPSERTFCEIFERLSGSVLGLCNHDVPYYEQEDVDEVAKTYVDNALPEPPNNPMDDSKKGIDWIEENFRYYEIVMEKGTAMTLEEIESEQDLSETNSSHLYRAVFRDVLYDSRVEANCLKKQVNTLEKQLLSTISKQKEKEDFWKNVCNELKVSNDVKSTLIGVFEYYTAREEALEARCAELRANSGVDLDFAHLHVNTLQQFCQLIANQYAEIKRVRILYEEQLVISRRWEKVMDLNSKKSLSLLASLEAKETKLNENQALFTKAQEFLEEARLRLSNLEKKNEEEDNNHKRHVESYKNIINLMTGRLKESLDKESFTRRLLIKVNTNLMSVIHRLTHPADEVRDLRELLQHYSFLEVPMDSSKDTIDLKALLARENHIDRCINSERPAGKLTESEATFFLAKNLRFSLTMMALVSFYTGEKLGDCIVRWAEWYEAQLKDRKALNVFHEDIDEDFSDDTLSRVVVPQVAGDNPVVAVKPSAEIVRFRDNSYLETSPDQVLCYRNFAMTEVGQIYFKYPLDFHSIRSCGCLAHYCDMDVTDFVSLSSAQRVSRLMRRCREHTCNEDPCPFLLDKYIGQFNLSIRVFNLLVQEYVGSTSMPLNQQHLIDPHIEIVNDGRRKKYGPELPPDYIRRSRNGEEIDFP